MLAAFTRPALRVFLDGVEFPDLISGGPACFLTTATVVFAADPGAEDPNNWPLYNRTANAWRYNPLDQINKDNVSKLSVAWIAHGGNITMGIGKWPKSNCLTIIKRPAGTDIPIQLLVRDRTPRQARQ
jgi:hypothetical protein